MLSRLMPMPTILTPPFRDGSAPQAITPDRVWQDIFAAGTFAAAGPFRDTYPAALTGGEILLPIRALADGRHALASLIVNQASFAVQDALAEALAEALEPFQPEIVVGLPTLGLTLASAVARLLGHRRYVPLGTSRKFWYRDELSVPISSITTPGMEKRLYVDPRMLDLLAGRRVALIDDVISSGVSILAGLRLMEMAGVKPVAVGAAMLQTERWRAALREEAPPVRGVFRTPLLMADGEGGGWTGVKP